jgi:multisubunit Na+/H+ antiporter MnhE subunit
MSTLWFWSSIFILGLALLGTIPGVRELFRPLIDLTTRAVVGLAAFSGGYLLWLVKAILFAHADLARHLAHPRRHFDPAEQVDRRE